jgi:hypothetical protein
MLSLLFFENILPLKLPPNTKQIPGVLYCAQVKIASICLLLGYAVTDCASVANLGQGLW